MSYGLYDSSADISMFHEKLTNFTILGNKDKNYLIFLFFFFFFFEFHRVFIKDSFNLYTSDFDDISKTSYSRALLNGI